MKTRILLLLSSCLLLAATPACVTVKVPSSVVVEARDAHHFQVEGQETDLAGLVKAVKKTGAEPDTRIELRTPATMPNSEMAIPHAVLQSAGFREIFLIHPREATIEVTSPGQVAPAKAPAPAPSRTLSPTKATKRK